MNFWQIIAGIAPLAVIFGFFTLIIHIYQTRLLRKWRDESRELLEKWRDESREDHKTHEETLKYVAGVAERVEEGNKYIAGVAARVEEGNKYIAGVAERVEEGNKYIAGVAERVAGMAERVEENQKYIADLVVVEGQKTREVIQDRF